MDPLSQGLLGASLSKSFSQKEHLKLATLCGALGGMAPDLDILIRSKTDPLMFIEYHRHFTHSIAFIPIGGLIVAGLLYMLLKNKLSFKQIYIYTTIGLATHGFLDACTSYGTRLFWPLLDLRISWNIISIIDPIFTCTLLVFLILSLVRKSQLLIRTGLFLSLLYLSFGYIKHEQVKSFIYQVASERGHTIERILLNPTIGNNILWRSVYQYDGNYYIDAVYKPILTPAIIQEGEVVEVIDKDTVFSQIAANSVQRNDIRRFSYFSQDYIYLHPDYNNVIADLRYGTLPYDNKSLWGIKVDIDEPDLQRHVEYIHLRNLKDSHYDEFWLMLNGDLKSSE